MINLELLTKRGQMEAMDRMKRFFGNGCLGLDISEEAPQCFSFGDGGGYVAATIRPEVGRECTSMDKESRREES